jgi:hypothetical protein
VPPTCHNTNNSEDWKKVEEVRMAEPLLEHWPSLEIEPFLFVTRTVISFVLQESPRTRPIGSLQSSD